MRAIGLLSVVLMFGLAACGSGQEPAATDAVPAEQVAAQVQGAIKPLPGKYTSRMELVDFSMPGMPEALKAQMKAAFESGLSQGNEFCMTAEQADPREMLQGMAESKCSFGRFNIAGGRVDAEMNCTGDDGVASKVQMQGQMAAESSDMTMAMERPMEGLGTISMKMRVQSQRVGACS